MTLDDLRTPAYDEYERGILTLHEMSLAGQDGSPEADALRERLLAPWAELTPGQRSFGDGVSADLFMLEPDEREVFMPATDQERSPQRLGLAIAAAGQRQDSAAVLSLLRLGPTFLIPAQVAFLRTRAYDRLGRPAVALAFARFARAADPSDPDLEVLESDLLTRTGHLHEAATLAWRRITVGHPLPLVVHAAGELFGQTRDQDDATARSVLLRLVDVLRLTLATEPSPSEPDVRDYANFGHLLLAACLDGVGAAAEADREYRRAADEIVVHDAEDAAFCAALLAFLDDRTSASAGPVNAHGPVVADEQRTTVFAFVSASMRRLAA